MCLVSYIFSIYPLAQLTVILNNDYTYSSDFVQHFILEVCYLILKVGPCYSPRGVLNVLFKISFYLVSVR